MTGREREIWLKTGQCYTCANYTYPGPEKHECISDPCDEETEFKQKDGTCYTCEEDTYPDPATDSCAQDTCDDTQYLQKNGKCF